MSTLIKDKKAASKSIFDMGLEELNSKLAKVADEVKKNALDFGSY